MSLEWIETTLGKICESQGGAIQTGPFGSQLHTSDYKELGIPVVMPTNINDGSISEDGIARIDDIDVERLSQHKLRLGDIIFSRRGDVTKNALIRLREIGWLCGTGCLKVRLGNESLATASYISHCLRHPDTKDWLIRHAVGATMPNLNTGILSNVPINLPSLQAQKKIANTLDTLDDRITLLRETNATLEAIAQALFKSWFVDFDPVHAKAQGTKPEGMDEQTAALFPDSFEESELGMVPAGWEVGKLKNVVKVIDNRGKTPPYQDIATKYPIIEVNALKGDDRLVDYSAIKKYVSEETFNSWFRGHPKKFDTLIATVGSIGATSMFLIEKGSIAQNVIALTPITLSPIYLFQYLKKVKGEIKELDIGSVQPSIKVPHLLATKILIPSGETLGVFDSIIECSLEKIAMNYEQIQTLTDLRDTLLPRLISGQLRLPDVEA